MKKDIKERITLAIKQMNLSNDELKSITYGNMEKLCSLAKVDMLDLMWYLRYER